MDYHIAIAGQQQGPISETEVLQMIGTDKLSAEDLCWTDGWPDWKPVVEAFPQAFAPTTPMAPPPVPTAGLGAAPAAMRKNAPKTSGLAVTSLVLGLFSFGLSLFGAIPAIICGHLARAKIKRSAGVLDGAGLALAGLILGYFFLVFGVFTIAAILLPTIERVRETAQYTVSQSNVRQILQAEMLYAIDHDDRLADDIEALREILGSSFDELMDLPYTDEVETDGYIIVPGLTMSMPRDTIVVRESKPHRDGWVSVGYLAGHIDLVLPGLPPPPPPSE